MKNYCYICLLTACMAPMSLQAQKAIPYSGEVCVACSTSIKKQAKKNIKQPWTYW